MHAVRLLEHNPLPSLTVAQAARELSLIEGEEVVDLRPMVMAEIEVQGRTHYNDLMDFIRQADC